MSAARGPGQGVSATRPPARAGAGADAPPALLAVEEVSRRFGRIVAVAPTSFRVGGGEMVVLAAPAGAGKTTLFRVIAGELPPTAGRVSLAGRSLGRLPPHARARLGMVRVQSPPRPFGGMTVFDNVRVAAHFGRRPRVARAPTSALPGAAELAASLQAVHGASEAWPGEIVDPSARAAAALAYCGLDGDRDLPVGRLAPGQAVRLELARAIAANPLVLLADQPLDGLDETAAAEVVRLLRRARRAGLAVVACERPGGPLGAAADRVVRLAPGDGARG